MGFIRTIFSLVIVFIIIVFGYWLYATYTTTNASADNIWVNINTYMPEPLRDWSCGEIRGRMGPNAPAPVTC
ncbi:MAG: hypothetical protein H7X92_08645 [Chitinophagales bacterium]|nr:hypothetical protein [Hyphomicrobiales bacterium]